MTRPRRPSRRVGVTAPIVTLLLLCGSAAGQTPIPPPPPQPPPSVPRDPPPPPRVQRPSPRQARHDRRIGIRGVGTLGGIRFAANDSFETVLGRASGLVAGGGGQVLLPWGLYAELGVSRFTQDGERVFIGPGNEVFRLGVPTDITITPIELTAGWRYRLPSRPTRRAPVPRPSRVTVYGGAGLSSYGYRETSEGAAGDDVVDDRFAGAHLVGGAEYALSRWIAIGGEVGWSSIADALGAAGVSAAFGEDNLGGTAIRLKVSIGR